MIGSITCLGVIAVIALQAGAQTGIGTITPAASSVLDVSSASGGLLIPRVTAQRSAIVSPALALQVFQTDGNPGICYYNGVNWQSLTNGTPVDNLGFPPNYGTVTTYAGNGSNTT